MTLKTMYPFIEFIQIPKKSKTSAWNCCTRQGDILGEVRWFSGWRQYCFFPTVELATVFSAGCLDNIRQFINALMAERKAVSA